VSELDLDGATSTYVSTETRPDIPARVRPKSTFSSVNNPQLLGKETDQHLPL
jgi:hypothetical protein